jgi:sporulation protein YlmC with PRC-barrel domain
MEEKEHNHTALRLQELNDSDFEIADDQPDIINWLIVDVNGDEIGEVEDVIFDLESRKVLYIVSLIDNDNEEGFKRVLIPIGVVDFNEAEDEVVMSESVADLIDTLPVYKPGTVISPAEELAIRFAFLGNDALIQEGDQNYQAHPEDFYSHHHFSTEKYKKRNP